MRDQQDGQPLLGGAPSDDGAHLGAGRHVQGGHGLVEDEGARARGQGAGQGHPGGLTPRQLAAGARGQVRGAHGRELGAGAPTGPRAGGAPAARPEGDVVQDAHVREDPRGLGQQGDVAPPGRHEGAGAVQDALAQAHPADFGVEQSGGHGAGGGLARAVGADERQGAAGLDGQIDDDVAGGGGEGDAQGSGLVGPRRSGRPGAAGSVVGTGPGGCHGPTGCRGLAGRRDSGGRAGRRGGRGDGSRVGGGRGGRGGGSGRLAVGRGRASSGS